MAKISIRDAQSSDLDPLTAIRLSSFRNNPATSYGYPYAEQFPDEHYHYIRLQLSEYLDNVEVGAYAVMLAECVSNEDPSTKEAIAMSVWKLSGTHGANPNGPSDVQKAMKPRADYSARRDANKARVAAVVSGIIQSSKVHFNPVYGEKQLSLILIGIRPKYQKLGAGTALVEWGVQKAREEGLTLNLFSQSAGPGLLPKSRICRDCKLSCAAGWGARVSRHAYDGSPTIVGWTWSQLAASRP